MRRRISSVLRIESAYLYRNDEMEEHHTWIMVEEKSDVLVLVDHRFQHSSRVVVDLSIEFVRFSLDLIVDENNFSLPIVCHDWNPFVRTFLVYFDPLSRFRTRFFHKRCSSVLSSILLNFLLFVWQISKDIIFI